MIAVNLATTVPVEEWNNDSITDREQNLVGSIEEKDAAVENIGRIVTLMIKLEHHRCDAQIILSAKHGAVLLVGYVTAFTKKSYDKIRVYVNEMEENTRIFATLYPKSSFGLKFEQTNTPKVITLPQVDEDTCGGFHQC